MYYIFVVVSSSHIDDPNDENANSDSLPLSALTKSARRRRIRKEKSKAAAASFRLYYANEPVPVSENDSSQNNCVSEASTNSESETAHIQTESVEESAPVSKSIPAPAPTVKIPPTDVQLIIDKMASYVAKNGRDFEDVVKAKGQFS